MERLLVATPEPAVRVVTLNRPTKLNASDRESWETLGRAFRGFAQERTIRLVILTGAGGNFSAGDDINAYAATRGDELAGAAYRAAIHEAHKAIEEAPFPVVAAIDGVCVGGGCSIALCCDFRIGTAVARIGIPAAKLGLVYSLEHCQRLAATVGLGNARRMLYRGDIVSGAVARDLGFLDELAEGDVLHASRAFGAPMAENAPLSIAASKKTLSAIAMGQALSKQAEIADAFRKADQSHDAAEGARAFAEKRRPSFSGQ